MSRAHPRVCGENTSRARRERRRNGSSPRVRGKLTHCEPPKPVCWLIPACAGKTRDSEFGWVWNWAHPRVCGENLETSESADETTGSSPRVRGKPVESLHKSLHRGLIPACAGKTIRACWEPLQDWAHPRVCGENPSAAFSKRSFSGSSPRVRGKHPAHGRNFRCLGLIPACAGKTMDSIASQTEMRAHPRVCGENDLSGARGSPATGSSPRVRGKRRGQCKP